MQNSTTALRLQPEKTEQLSQPEKESFQINAISKTTGFTSALIPSPTAIIFIELFILITCIGVSLLLGEMLGKS
jgi:hypothetical protein